MPYAVIVVTRDTAMRLDSAGTGPSRTITADSRGKLEVVDLIPSTYELRGRAGAPVLVTLGTAERVDGVEVIVAK